MYYSDLPLFIKPKTASVSGHRILKRDFSEEKLKSDLKNIILSGYEYFLIGMAKGFDCACFSALIKLKEEFDFIKLVAVIPCLDQTVKFNKKEKELYETLLKSADYKVIIKETYEDGCMLKRNDFMVENSSILYAYYSGIKKGGTYYTVRRAEKDGLKIILY